MKFTFIQEHLSDYYPADVACQVLAVSPTEEGWLYLAGVIDLCSRRVVGWSMADHMRTELVSDALKIALAGRRPD